MTALDNKKLMEAVYDSIAHGDGRLFADALADDVTMHITGQHSWSRTFRGKASLLKDLYGYVFKLVAGRARMHALRFFADGDHVIVEARGEMLTKAGERYDNEYCIVYRLHNGKIAEIREYCDSALTEKRLGPFPS